MSQTPSRTTAAGIPVAVNQNSLSAGPRGPLLLQDFQPFEKLRHFNPERIPERVVHAKGSGAYGTFTVTHDIAKCTKAKRFAAVGKTTEAFVRFSTVGGEKGSADTERDPRGFATRFYTEEGNWDLVGNNTPMFFSAMAIDNGGSAANCENVHAAGTAAGRFGHGAPGGALNGVAGRFDERGASDDFTQAGNLFRLMKPDAKVRLTSNIAAAMKDVGADVKKVQIGHFTKADPACGAAVARKLAAMGAMDPEVAKAFSLVKAG